SERLASLTLRLLPPLLKKGKGRSRHPRFRLWPTSHGTGAVLRLSGHLNVVVRALNPVGSAAPAGRASLRRWRRPRAEPKSRRPRDTGSRCLPDGPIQAILVVLHAQ